MVIIRFPLIILSVIILLYFFLVLFAKSRIYSFERVPYNHYTLVLGAGLDKNGLPSDILSDRVKTAVNLIESKKTDFLILSGSTKNQRYSEPASMKVLALSLGVEDSKLIIDNQGISTIHSLVNLSNLGIRQVTIVSQGFHLPRAIWLGKALGLIVCGTAANIYTFSWHKRAYWYLREAIAIPFNYLKLIKHRYHFNA